MRLKYNTKSAADDKKKSDNKRNTINRLFYVVSAIALIGSVAIIIVLLCNFQSWKSNYVVFVSLAACLFTFTMTLSSLFSYVNSQRIYKNESNEKQISGAENLIREFNKEYLEDSMQLFRIIEVTNKIIGLSFDFDPSLEIQDSKIDLFKTSFGETKYKNELFVCSCSRFYTSGFLSGKLEQYCELVLKEKEKYKEPKSRGRTEIESVFRLKRIRLLNFLEGLAVSYVNSTADREMIISQFSSFIKLCISRFYILIFFDEGLGCYPCLKILANELLERA